MIKLGDTFKATLILLILLSFVLIGCKQGVNDVYKGYYIEVYEHETEDGIKSIYAIDQSKILLEGEFEPLEEMYIYYETDIRLKFDFVNYNKIMVYTYNDRLYIRASDVTEIRLTLEVN